MLLSKYLKAWLTFNKSPTDDALLNNWSTFGNPSVSSTNAINGNALQLDGQSYIKLSGIELGGQDFYIDGWIYVDSSSPANARIISIVNPNNGYSLASVRKNSSNSSRIDFWYNSTADVSVDYGYTAVPAVTSVGTRVHFALIYRYTDKVFHLCINDGTYTGTTSAIQYNRQTFDIYIGALPNRNQGLIGSIDELRIYDGTWFSYSYNNPPDASLYQSISFKPDAQRIVSNPAFDDLVAANTKVLLHFDDDNDPFFDECGNSWTAYNNPTISATNAKSSNALQLAGGYTANTESGQYLALDGGITLGGKDFTVDGWACVDSNCGSYARIFSFFNSFGSNGNYAFTLSADKNCTGFYINFNGSSTSTVTITKGTLFHFAVVYQHSIGRIDFFVDGSKIGSINTTFPQTYYQYVFLGRANYKASDTYYFKGSIDEFRIVDGVALWTDNFTPPSDYSKTISLDFDADTQRLVSRNISLDFDAQRIVGSLLIPVDFSCDSKRFIKNSITFDADTQRFVSRNINFTADSQRLVKNSLSFITDAQRVVSNPAFDDLVAANTKVLLHFDDDNDPFFDECGNSWTLMGNPVIAADNAKFGKAIQFDGDYNFLILRDEQLEIGGQDFTIDCFFFVSSQSNYYFDLFRIEGLIEFRPTWSYKLCFATNADWRSGMSINYYTDSAISANLANALHHLEIVYQYDEQLVSLFIDGVKQFQLSGVPKILRQTAQTVWIGFNSGLIGSIDEFRIVDGVALHTQDFTPPSAPYSAFPKSITFDADSQRLISRSLTFDADAQRIFYKTFNDTFDTQRIIQRSINLDFDAQINLFVRVDFLADASRNILHKFIVTPAAGGILYADSNDNTDIQSIQLDIAPQQVTDQFSFATVSNVDILQQVKGQYLDYIFNLRIEKISSKGILHTCLCCADVDELLYKQLAYKVKGTSGGSFVVDNNGKTITQEKPKASALAHITKIANILGKNLVTAFDNFISTVDTDPQGVTYNDLIRDIFGWSSRVPTKLINCYIRNDSFFVIQRGHEQNIIDISNAKITLPTITKELFRTTWGSTPNSWTVTQKNTTYGDWEPILGNPLPDDYPSTGSDDDDDKEPSDTSRVLPRRVENPDSVIEYQYDDDGNVTKTTTTTADSKTVVENFYEVISGRKYLAKEITTEYDYDKVTGQWIFIDSSTVYHDYLTQGQQNITAIDSDGKIKGSLTSSAKVDDRPTPFEYKRYAKSVDGVTFTSTGNPDWATYTYVNGVKYEVLGYRKVTSYDDKELTINGIALYDSSFPIDDVATLRALTSELQRLNRTTQETITLDIFDYPHIFDFNDRIIFGGYEYFIDSNSVSKTPRIVNKQSLKLVRWI